MKTHPTPVYAGSFSAPGRQPVAIALIYESKYEAMADDLRAQRRPVRAALVALYARWIASRDNR